MICRARSAPTCRTCSSTKLDWWVLLGFIAQACSPCASWCSGSPPNAPATASSRSAFWIFSIGGGLLLLVYALYRKDPVFIAGQAFGVFVYLRNLHFVMRDRKAAATAA